MDALETELHMVVSSPGGTGKSNLGISVRVAAAISPARECAFKGDLKHQQNPATLQSCLSG